MADPVSPLDWMDAPALLRRGQDLASRGRLAEAAEVLDRAVSLDPNAPHLLDARARLHLERDELPEAIGLLERAAALPSAGREIHNNLAVALMRHGQPMRARDLFDETLRRFGHHLAVIENRALVRLELGDVDGAIADLSTVLAATPQREEPWRRKALAHIRLWQLREAHHAALTAARLLWAKGGSKRDALGMAVLGASIGVLIRLGVGETGGRK